MWWLLEKIYLFLIYESFLFFFNSLIWRWMFRFKVSLEHHLVMSPCSSISTDKPADQIQVIPRSECFGSLLIKAFYLLSKSTADALLKRGLISFPLCWNPCEIIGVEVVVKSVFSVRVIQTKLFRPAMYRLLHTEFLPLGNWSQLILHG